MTDDFCERCRWRETHPDPDHGAPRDWCAAPEVQAGLHRRISRCSLERDSHPEPWRGDAGRKCGPEHLNYEFGGET